MCSIDLYISNAPLHSGGESVYGEVFADEFHSRLRFKHRGLVARAGVSSPNSNGSQFFLTLDRCECLDEKHTICGKVTGDSIYNLSRLGEVETDKDDQPLNPPKKLSVEVLWNPFDDIVPRVAPSKTLPSTLDGGKRDTKHKATKKLNLLSFGEEAEEEEKELAAVNTKVKSSHDVLDDPRFLKDENRDNLVTVQFNSANASIKRDVQLTVREALSTKREEQLKQSEAGFPNPLTIVIKMKLVLMHKY